MSVQRIGAECYLVRTDAKHPESGTFFVRDWTSPRNGDTHYGGTLAACTSYGNFAAQWTHCGVPFKRFLTGLDFSYFMQKATPGYREFDFEGSLAGLRQRLLEERRAGGLDKPTAAAIWEGLARVQSNGDTGGHAFVNDLYEIRALRRLTQEPYEYARERPTAAAKGFWDVLWPLFVAKLRDEQAVPA